MANEPVANEHFSGRYDFYHNRHSGDFHQSFAQKDFHCPVGNCTGAAVGAVLMAIAVKRLFPCKPSGSGTNRWRSSDKRIADCTNFHSTDRRVNRWDFAMGVDMGHWIGVMRFVICNCLYQMLPRVYDFPAC